MHESTTNNAFQTSHISPKYFTVEQFSSNNPAFTKASLRNLIFKANVRQSSRGLIPGNGLLEAKAIIRIGRKVLIHEEHFFQWIESHADLISSV